MIINKLKHVIIMEDDFEKFQSSQNENKILVMSFFKRTYKLLVCMNKNIPIMSIDWMNNLCQNGYNEKDMEDYFLQRKNKYSFFNQLKISYFYRKKLGHGFMLKYRVIRKNK